MKLVTYLPKLVVILVVILASATGVQGCPGSNHGGNSGFSDHFSPIFSADFFKLRYAMKNQRVHIKKIVLSKAIYMYGYYSTT